MCSQAAFALLISVIYENLSCIDRCTCFLQHIKIIMSQSAIVLLTNAKYIHYFSGHHQRHTSKKLDLRGYDHPRHCIKKKTFSRRPRKPPNPCPTLTQRHRRPVRTGRSLDLCFGVGQTRVTGERNMFTTVACVY